MKSVDLGYAWSERRKATTRSRPTWFRSVSCKRDKLVFRKRSRWEDDPEPRGTALLHKGKKP